MRDDNCLTSLAQAFLVANPTGGRLQGNIPSHPFRVRCNPDASLFADYFDSPDPLLLSQGDDDLLKPIGIVVKHMGLEGCRNDLTDFAGLLTEIIDQLILVESIDKDKKKAGNKQEG